MSTPADIAARIDALCAAQSISLAELCRRAQLPAPNYVSRMRSGEVSGRKHLPAIATALGISIDDLLSPSLTCDGWEAWIKSLTEADLAELPPFVAKWRSDIRAGGEARTHALHEAAAIPAKINLDGSVDYRMAILDPLEPLAAWHRQRATHANELLRQLNEARAANALLAEQLARVTAELHDLRAGEDLIEQSALKTVVGPKHKSQRPLFRPDQAPAPATTR